MHSEKLCNIFLMFFDVFYIAERIRHTENTGELWIGGWYIDLNTIDYMYIYTYIFFPWSVDDPYVPVITLYKIAAHYKTKVYRFHRREVSQKPVDPKRALQWERIKKQIHRDTDNLYWAMKTTACLVYVTMYCRGLYYPVMQG